MNESKYNAYIELHVPTRFGHKILREPVSDADVEAAMKLADEAQGSRHHPDVHTIMQEVELQKAEARPSITGQEYQDYPKPEAPVPVVQREDPAPFKRSHHKRLED